MAILVTGGAGFIGSHLIERLIARDDNEKDGNEKIVCLDNFNDYYAPAQKRANVAAFARHPRVVVVEQSFGDPAAMRHLLAERGVRRIVHLGGYAGVRASFEQPLLYEEHNVHGTLSLLEAARTTPLERFLFVSSSTVYGLGCQVPFREDGPLGTPLSPYGMTKRAAELHCFHYHQDHGVPAVCLRPFSVYGPRTRPDLALHIFASAILAGRPIPLFGDGTLRRDFTHVSDICDGLLAALDAPHVVGEAINLGHHKPVAIRELIALLEELLGRAAVIEQQPAAPGDLPITCADLTKAGRLLGYQPKIELRDGIADFVRWLRR